MRHETFDAKGRLRQRRDDNALRVTRWDEEGNVVADDAYSPDEVAQAEASAEESRREARWRSLLGRVEAAQQGNRDSRATLAQIAGATFATAQQRDNAIKFLAGRVEALTVQNNALMQLVLRLAGRFDALDNSD